MNLAGVEGENGAQAGVFLPYSRHALPWVFPGGIRASWSGVYNRSLVWRYFDVRR